MDKQITKIVDLEYNELVTLGVIDATDDLKDIFTDEVKLPFSALYRLSKEGSLSDDTKDMLNIIFEKLILTKKEYVQKYLRLADVSGVKITQIDNVELEPIEPQATPIVKDLDVEVVIEKQKPIKETKIPRRYGKQAIEEDIEKQGGKPTNVQLAALAVNDLKNIAVNLNARLIKDMVSENKLLTDEDYRDIKSTIKIVQNKLKLILKKK